MKTSLIGFIVLFFVFFSFSCSEEQDPDEPIEYSLFFKITDQAGGDFILNNPDYDLEDIIFLTPGGQRLGIPYELHGENYLFIYEGGKVLIKYNDDEVDTLSEELRTNGIKEANRKVFLNGQLVLELDFENDPELIRELGIRNGYYNKADCCPDPIIFSINK